MRYERRHQPNTPDQRAEPQRDRDRVLYCSALRRLAGVTQVVGVNEGGPFHNRLTHTLETAQIGRRLAEKFLDEGVVSESDVNADIVEAAGLSHDLGHAPFGHAGEDELNKCAVEAGLSDGFEGNPQSFRILTHLSAHRPGYHGLNLTRATLRASMKYPIPRALTDGSQSSAPKFGAYDADREAFDWVTMGDPSPRRSLEAEIMDLADDIAYSVHDLDDFIQCGLVPIHRFSIRGLLDEFLDEWKSAPESERRYPEEEIERHRAVARVWLTGTAGIPRVSGEGRWKERALWKEYSAGMIARFVRGAEIVHDADGVQRARVPDELRFLLKLSQRIVWEFVIRSPQLASQQHGQRRIVRELFSIYNDVIASDGRRAEDLLPRRFADQLHELTDASAGTRLAVDVVSSLTDLQACTLFARLTGTALGSLSDFSAR